MTLFSTFNQNVTARIVSSDEEQVKCCNVEELIQCLKEYDAKYEDDEDLDEEHEELSQEVFTINYLKSR